MHECKCLCGKVSFRLLGRLHSARYCHCTNCRKFSGTSPAAWAMAQTADLEAAGDLPITRFDSGRGLRCFCTECGSPVWFESKEFPEIVGIPLGIIDSGDVPAPEMHLWVQSKPGWCAVAANLPRLSAGPDSATYHDT